MIKWNGENWYEAPPLLKRIRQWLIWIGGWERVNSKGWRVFYKNSSGKWKLNDPTPFSLLGSWFTCYGWGLNIKLLSGYLVVTWGRHGKKCYISPNGTPSQAHTWYWGTPKEILDVTVFRHQQGG